MQLTLARGLEQNGQWPSAADMLERLCREVTESARCGIVEPQLIRLYIDVGRHSLAEEHLRSITTLGLKSNAAPGWAAAKADVFAARLAFERGDLSEAQQVARRCCVDLRSENANRPSQEVGVALIDAINFSSNIAFTTLNVTDAVQLAAEALTLLHKYRITDIGTLIETRLTNAALQFIVDDPAAARQGESELRECYRLAVTTSQTRDAISIAVTLATRLRHTALPADAIELLKPLRDVVNAVGIGDEVVGFLLELGNAALETGDVAVATRCLNDLHEVIPATPLVQPLVRLFSSRVADAQSKPELSLMQAEAAETGLVRTGRRAFLGQALFLQAVSLAKLGRTDRAVRTLHAALEHHKAANQARALTDDYLLMGTLTGDSRFRPKARLRSLSGSDAAHRRP